jgi:hypothetical protein
MVTGVPGESVSVNWLGPGASSPTTYTCLIGESTVSYLSVPSGVCSPTV